MWQGPLRCALPSLVVCLLAVAAFPSALAGTATSPEITDPKDDQKTTQGGQTTCPSPIPVGVSSCFSNADVVAGWVDQETATSFQVHILITGTGAPASLGTSYTWDYHMKVGGTDYIATAHLQGLLPQNTPAGPYDGSSSFSGVADSGNIQTADTGGTITMTVKKDKVGNPTGGDLADLWIDSRGYGGSNNQQVNVQDRAPDGAAFGTPYPLMGGSNTTGNKADSDADGLNDTWEQQKFGGLSQNGTGDPDKDDCNNKCEFDHGSDPNKKDTDGDGYSDGEEVKAGFSPTDPASHPNMNGTSTSKPPTSSSSTSGPPTSESSSNGGAGGGGDGNTSKASPLNFIDAFVAVAGVLLVRRRLAA